MPVKEEQPHNPGHIPAEAFPLTDLPARLESGGLAKVGQSKCLRWVLRGHKGVKLKAWKFGGRRRTNYVTTMADALAFLRDSGLGDGR